MHFNQRSRAIARARIPFPGCLSDLWSNTRCFHSPTSPPRSLPFFLCLSLLFFFFFYLSPRLSTTPLSRRSSSARGFRSVPLAILASALVNQRELLVSTGYCLSVSTRTRFVLRVGAPDTIALAVNNAFVPRNEYSAGCIRGYPLDIERLNITGTFGYPMNIPERSPAVCIAFAELNL